MNLIIGGESAFIDYISSGQVNVQVPEAIPIGAGVLLVLKTAQGQSDSYILQTAETAPALLRATRGHGQRETTGGRDIPDHDANNVVCVGHKGSIDGIDMKPASPGDLITLYGIGFGPVSPGTAAGIITGQSNSLTNQGEHQFGDIPAEVQYAGLAPGNVGLYQFTVKAPAVPAGDWPLTVRMGNQTLTTSMYTVTQ